MSLMNVCNLKNGGFIFIDHFLSLNIELREEKGIPNYGNNIYILFTNLLIQGRTFLYIFMYPKVDSILKVMKSAACFLYMDHLVELKVLWFS